MPEVSIDTIRTTTIAALIRHGASDTAAAAVADAVAEAEATGNRICGLYYLESYCRQLTTGRVKGDAIPLVTRPRPGHVAVDAGFGFAQPAFAAGLPKAITAACENGTALLTIAHSHTATAMGYFTGHIARAGLIGLGMTNASPTVAAPGGRKRVIGTNPIAFSVPDGQGGVAMQFDFSTSATALGSITMAKEAGQAIPEGWAVDDRGQPTTDPDAALSGALSSAGGYKGWGVGMMVELLAAAMTGSTLSKDVHPLREDAGPPHDFGQTYMLIDPSGAPDFGGAFGQLADAIAADPGARIPGQGRSRSPKGPITVDDSLWQTACDLAA